MSTILEHPEAQELLAQTDVEPTTVRHCARRWCGRLGKVDNCQVGVFLAYVAARGKALVDCRLFLPRARAAERKHRTKTFVPTEVVFAEKWRLGLELVRTSGQELPHGWV